MPVIRQILSFIGIVLVQVFIFNNILFHGYLNPYVYLIFILFLPIKMPRPLVLLCAFALGFCIDIFENSGGVHIAASVFLAYFRLPLLKVAARKRGEDFKSVRMRNLSLPSISIYCFSGIFIHHFLLFMIESYSLLSIGTVLVRTFLSSFFTFVFVLAIQLWNFRKKD